jgi:hypothetical protein
LRGPVFFVEVRMLTLRLSTALALCFVAFASARASAPNATVAQETFDFGSVKQGARIDHAFTVKNSGDGPLRFAGADLSLPGMQIRLAPAEVAPGGEGTVTITWATDHVAGAVEGVATVRSNDPVRPQLALTVRGSVVPSISIEPLPAVFLSTFAGDAAERVLTIRNNADTELAAPRIEPGPHVVASVKTVQSGKTFAIAVRAAPDAAPGRYEETLRVETGNAATGVISIPVHLWVKPDLYANPDSVDFGTVAVGDPNDAPSAASAPTQTVMLKRRSGTFEIESISSDSPLLVATRSPASGPSDAFSIDARLRPELLWPGATVKGNLRIRTNDPKFPEVVVPVTGSAMPSRN